MSASSKIKELQKHLETSLKDAIKQAQKVEKSARALKQSVVKNIDKDKAQANFLKFVGKSRQEVDLLKIKLEKQVASLKIQAKAIADSERAKRRARRGSK